jgi:hypothetical protein
MDRAISPFEAQDLLQKARVNNIGDINLTILQQIMNTMKSDIERMKQNGFTSRNAMFTTTSREYIWAHTTAPGIIWLWAQQDADTRAQWINEPKSKWENFVPKEPSPDAPLYGFTPSVSTSPSASRASVGSTSGTGAVSVPPYGTTAASPFSFGSSSSIPPSNAPFSLAPGFGSVSVPNTPTGSSSPGGGYRKRRTHKTRRKSNRRGRSRSRSRSHQIRRKKTHHRRHRR